MVVAVVDAGSERGVGEGQLIGRTVEHALQSRAVCEVGVWTILNAGSVDGLSEVARRTGQDAGLSGGVGVHVRKVRTFLDTSVGGVVRVKSRVVGATRHADPVDKIGPLAGRTLLNADVRGVVSKSIGRTCSNAGLRGY